MVNGNIDKIKKAALKLSGIVVGVITIGVTALVTLSKTNNKDNLDGNSGEIERGNDRWIDYDRFDRR